MIRYSLDLKVGLFPKLINTQDRIVLMGSCFTEHIGKQLSDFCFDVFTNPNGVVFNPVSLAEPVKRILNKKKYTEEDLLYHDNKWVSMFHHGKFSSVNKDECLEYINKEQKKFENYIASAQWLIITFGTAWVYEYKEMGKIVANCHKIQQNHFSKRLLSVNEIVTEWEECMVLLKKINPDLNIIYTVSPVRHLRDGVHANNLSKGILFLAIEQLLDKKSHYFPAYELVIDDLRDYRFFEDDAAHPNTLAIDYVFDKFRQSLLSSESNQMMDALEKFFKLKNHRPLNNSNENIYELKDKTEALKSELINKYPHLVKQMT